VQAAIEARSVSHGTRAGDAAVRDVSLTVGLGELTAITGGSGSGKTTLLDALSGRRPPASGSVIRHPAAGPGPSGPSGYVPAGDVLPPDLPLARALRYTAALRAVPGGGRSGEQLVRTALGATGLAERAPVLCGDLSPGERKRAAIAAELMSRPAQLFLEEPTAGLDPAQAAEVLRLLRRLADDSLTVVLTTGSPLDTARCDKVAVLAAGGHLAFFGTPAAAQGYFGADSLEEIYERLAGLGDPAAAWSRRFAHFPPAGAGFVPAARPPGPAFPLPDSAGPLSAGRVNGTRLPGEPDDRGPVTGPWPAVRNEDPARLLRTRPPARPVPDRPGNCSCWPNVTPRYWSARPRPAWSRWPLRWRCCSRLPRWPAPARWTRPAPPGPGWCSAGTASVSLTARRWPAANSVCCGPSVSRA
jgi:ABC-type multidrug transport system ATPase subunit